MTIAPAAGATDRRILRKLRSTSRQSDPASRPRRTLKHGDTLRACSTATATSARRPAAPTACFTATPATCRISSYGSTGRSRCSWAPPSRDDNASLIVDLTNPEICTPSSNSCCRRTPCTSCARSLSDAQLSLPADRAAEPRRPTPSASRLSLAFDNDFADIFEVRGTSRARAAARSSRQVAGRCGARF